MNDRELLELAAEAAGYEVKDHPNNGITSNVFFIYNRQNWNPLTDDGDALRLAVNLDMHVRINRVDGWTEVVGGYNGQHRIVLRHSHDMYAATRCAIVRAAAEIGRGMP